MFSTFEKKPTSMALYIAVFGDFSPNIFQTAWFVKHNIISTSEAENLKHNSSESLIEFSYCRFEKRSNTLIFETDQLGYLPQTIDLVGLVLSVLKSSSLRRVEAHILTHYDVGDGSAFIGKVAKNQFWEDIVGGDYEYNGIEIKIPNRKNPKLDAEVFLKVCPSDSRQIHINVKDSVFIKELICHLSILKQ